MTLKTLTLMSSVGMALTALLVSACAPQPTGDNVSADRQQTASRVTFGTIASSRPVTVEANPRGAGAVAGTVAGGAAGAALGNQVGGGSGQKIATGVGAAAGAAAGHQIAASAQRTQSTEWFVQTEGGGTIAVIQASPVFSVGQRVQIIQSGGTTRLVPAT